MLVRVGPGRAHKADEVPAHRSRSVAADDLAQRAGERRQPVLGIRLPEEAHERRAVITLREVLRDIFRAAQSGLPKLR